MNERAPPAARSRKRAVNLTLSESLVREVRALTPNLSETVETLLAAHVAAESSRRAEREQAIDATIAWIRAHQDEHGLWGEAFSTL
ncbi:MAG: hypothetical protein BGO51_14220 [Rhodospirillales bacterium 69-11]|nr:type II toxin-antitoxin system CcdA family antitoxin [Rhodospirillales bacterium]OJW26554.1 MAG: hypothetical protein BGO51_14220 [Rhodospirillales bacterium 69-11]